MSVGGSTVYGHRIAVLAAMLERLRDRYYPRLAGFERFRDGTLPFYNWMLSQIPRDGVVLNIGAGSTPEASRQLRGRFRHLVGVDPDPVVLTNSDLDEAHVSDGLTIPFPNATFDAAYSDWTLEHVERPVEFLQEVRRVLKPGRHFWSRTTNRLHYVTVVSAYSPSWFHRLIANRVRRLPEGTHDPWPTYYRMNTAGQLVRFAQRAGFDEVEVRALESEPAYLTFHPGAFLVGVGYERLVNQFDWLSPLRLILLVRMMKTPAP
jgi:SAM-dependent methyltransferase